jgi:signal transduction histidine kinase
MPSSLQFRVRQRLVLAYTAVVAVAAGVLICVRPADWVGIVVTAVIGLLAAWLVACVGKHRVQKRLHELREITDALADGKLVQDLRGLPNDDFVKLAASVERLAAQLREMVAEQDRLRQRLSRSEQLAVIGELAATVAHEVNNPLDGLQNSIEIIRRRIGADEQVGPLLDIMEAGLARIETTVRRLLSMSRDEPIHPVPTPVEEIAEEALTFAQPRLNRYGIRLVREFPAEPVVVMADVDHMAQVLINLLVNAADAMRANGGTLTLRCRGGNDGRAWIEVADTGTGIPEQHLPHIFEPFYSTKGKDAGTGLGLAVVARVVEAHHGRIEVQTQAGAGTTFRIELPVGETVVVQAHPNPSLGSADKPARASVAEAL